MTGPAASWQCPHCGHVWISALGDALLRKHWLCSCGYDTREATKEREKERLRQLRKANLAQVLLLRAQGLTQREVAARLGISNATVSRMERRKGQQ